MVEKSKHNPQGDKDVEKGYQQHQRQEQIKKDSPGVKVSQDTVKSTPPFVPPSEHN